MGGKGRGREMGKEPQAMVQVRGDGDLDSGSQGSDSGGV